MLLKRITGNRVWNIRFDKTKTRKNPICVNETIFYFLKPNITVTQPLCFLSSS